MSTRCQIGFYEEGEKDLAKFEALIYRHSDGYPGNIEKEEPGVLMDIMPFLEWWAQGRGISDIEYCSARLLQYLCNEYDGRGYGLDPQKPEGQPFTGTLGHGISRQFHGDLAYFYAIRPTYIEVYSCRSLWDYDPSKHDINKFMELVVSIPIKQKAFSHQRTV